MKKIINKLIRWIFKKDIITFENKKFLGDEVIADNNLSTEQLEEKIKNELLFETIKEMYEKGFVKIESKKDTMLNGKIFKIRIHTIK